MGGWGADTDRQDRRNGSRLAPVGKALSRYDFAAWLLGCATLPSSCLKLPTGCDTDLLGLCPDHVRRP